MTINNKMEKLNSIRLRFTTGICFGGIGVIIFFISMGIFQTQAGMYLGLFLIVAGVLIGKGTHVKYQAIYKDLFAEEPLRKNFDDVFYAWKSGFSLQEVNDFELFPRGTEVKSEDYVKASFKGVYFQMADVTLIDMTKSGNSRNVYAFNGRILTFDFPDKAVSTIRIYSKEVYFRVKDNVMRTGKVKMESEKFNQAFDVYAEDAHDVFYLLTPQFMEQLIRLQRKYPHIAIKFQGNQVVVGFHDGKGSNSFDKTDWSNKVEYYEELAKVQSDINDVKNIINMICG